MNEQETRDAVKAGAKLLDEKQGGNGWRRDIDPDTLDMSSLYNCVLGQLYGTYGTGLAAVGIIRDDLDYTFPDYPRAKDYGFSLDESKVDYRTDEEMEHETQLLNRLWIDEVNRGGVLDR